MRIYSATSIIVYSNLLTSPSVKWQLRNNLPSQLTMANSEKRVHFFKISPVVSHLSLPLFIWGHQMFTGTAWTSVVSLFKCAQPDMRRVLSINNDTRQLPYEDLLHSRRISVYAVGTYFTTWCIKLCIFFLLSLTKRLTVKGCLLANCSDATQVQRRLRLTLTNAGQTASSVTQQAYVLSTWQF